MGNENKVNRSLSEVKSRFLPADIDDPNARNEIYALDKEFAAAAKNRSWTFYLITFGFLAAIVAATLIITQLVQGKHNKVELAIQEFEEIKLKDILSATRNDEKNLEVARRELETLRTKYREMLAELKERKASEAEVSKVRAEYNGKISAQQKSVADYEAKVNKRHREMNEGVAKVENILSNHERLMKLRLDKQQGEYEKKIADLILKYNPNFSEGELRKMVAVERTTTAIKTPVLAPMPPELTKEKITTKEKFEKLRALEAEERRLISRLRQVPYINSVAPALTGIERRNAEITAQYEALLAELVKTLRRKNEIINNYRSALKELTDREREYGYIIDARNKAKMRVYLNPSLRAKPGLKANIFRKDDEYIADIEIFFDNEGPCAKVLNIAEGKTIGAFDKIYLEDR
ncbi:MAG: hypothetical protein J0L53_02520 [Spirochaetes bacterium]|nr:hypothetical protein [Spirochaetota bacterium]MBX3721981.1 hypothetical protein [Turneriella sp.]